MSMGNKFISNPDDKLEEALALLAAGIPLAEVLREAGDDAEWLRPLLEIATEVGELRATIPAPSPAASLRRLLDYGQELAITSPAVGAAPARWQMIVRQLLGGGLLPRLATGLATAALVVVLAGGAVTVLAQRSLPGQPLYPLKRTGETLRLALTQDPKERERLLENYNLRRQLEARLLLEQGQAAPVTFEGRIEALTPTSLALDGWMVQLSRQTEVNGTLAVGARVRLEGLTQPPEALMALTITVIEAPLTPTPLPLPTSTPTLAPSATATPVRSQATDILKLPTATPQSQATDTLRLPTATPTPLPPPPTSTSTPTVVVTEPLLPPTAPPPPGSDNSNTNDNIDEGQGRGNDNDNSGSGGEDNSGSGGDDSGNSGSGDSGSSGSDGGSDDHSGSDGGSNESGGGDDHSNSGSSGSDSGGGDDSGSGGGSDDSGGGGHE